METEQRLYLLESKRDCLQLRNPGKVDEVAANLKDRYAKNQAVTAVGSSIALAINTKSGSSSLSSSSLSRRNSGSSSSAAANNIQEESGSSSSSSSSGTSPLSLMDIVHSAYSRMLNKQQDQSIILSGETGTGKSTCCRKVIHHLCKLALTYSDPNATTSSDPLPTTSDSSEPRSDIIHNNNNNKEIAAATFATISRANSLTRKINAAENILEAFGHAWSRSSPNSSRYSRYTELQFDKRGKLIGCKVLDYLLEKSRVSGKFSLGEANYHIFYYLLAGANTEEKLDWSLDEASSFNYLGFPPNGKSYASPFTNIFDAEKLDKVRDAFFALNVQRRQQHDIFHVISTILHLGNIQFMDSEQSNDPCRIKNKETLDYVAFLLGVSSIDLETALVCRTKLIHRELCTIYLSAEEAVVQRDCLAETLYSLLFSWILELINSRLCKDDCVTFIGILDFYGIDAARRGIRFEGLLNNYANERIHHFVMKRLVEDDMTEFKKDGVLDLSKMSASGFVSNSSQIEFLGSQGIGLLAAINRESLNLQSTYTPSASLDPSSSPSSPTSSASGLHLLSCLSSDFQSHPLFHTGSSIPLYSPATNASTYTQIENPSKCTFTIQHHVGNLEYDTSEMIDTNLDVLHPDFVTLLRGDVNMPSALVTPSTSTSGCSRMDFIRELFSDSLVSTRKHWKDQSVLVAAATSKAPSRKPSVRRKRKLIAKEHQKQLLLLSSSSTATTQDRSSSSQEPECVVDTLASSFCSAFDELIQILEHTSSWYIFCINPNQEEELIYASRFESRLVRKQLLDLGIPVIAGVKSAIHDVALKLSVAEFMDKFKLLVKTSTISLDCNPKDPNVPDLKKMLDFFNKIGWKSGTEYWIGTSSGLCYLTEASFSRLHEKLKDLQARIKFEESEAKKMVSEYYNNGLSWRSPASTIGSEPSSCDEGSSQRVESPRVIASSAPLRVLTGQSTSVPCPSHQPVSSPSLFSHPPPPPPLPVSLSLFNRNAASDKAALDLESGSGGLKKSLVVGELRHGDIVKAEDEKMEKASSGRRKWVCCTWFLTWWIPSYFLACCGMKRKDVQVAWREKTALCIIIFFLCAILLFFIIGLGRIICPRQDVYSIFELESKSDLNDAWVYGYGRVYKIDDIIRHHVNSHNLQRYQFGPFLGRDISPYFNKGAQWNTFCSGLQSPQPSNWNNTDNRFVNLASSSIYIHNETNGYYSYMNQFARGRVAWDWSYFSDGGEKRQKNYVVIFDNVYDVTSYFSTENEPFGSDFTDLFGEASASLKRDASSMFQGLRKKAQDLMKRGIKPEVDPDAVLRCMNEMLYVGTIDKRNTLECRLSNYILLSASALIASVILIKFLAALQFGSRRIPEDSDKFVVCMIPCYTEGVESLTKTLESVAVMNYDDKRKLLFVICDGMIIGSGNDRPTPRIVLDILGVDPARDPEPLSFQSLGEGDKQHNLGKVYAGLYEIQGHSVPFVVVVKVGKPSERQRPGNRGKRDSQMLLMRYLSRVHFNNEMTMLELELFHQMKNVIGVNPSFYEFVLMVDADTETRENALNVLVNTMAHDSKIVGLCGETLLSNEKDNWISMLQVYEYFISHHLSKAFESLFGSVTCLPGCFCMYRIRSTTNNIPLLISPQLLAEYSVNRVDTLHLKNLLHLGEDRYLTTLMMKHFPNMKLSYTSDAKCETNVPNQWSVLLSQRRRWINSTVHNLFELMFLPQLCGFCCLSMRFVVLLDLFSTLVQPASVLYVGYLLYALVSSTEVFPLISLCMLAGVYGLQVIIFIVKKQWGQIFYMLMYILALPIFSLYIPLYSFWHFDDFSWGNTRVAAGEGSKDRSSGSSCGESQPFDPRTIILKKWSEHESEMLEKLSKNSSSNNPTEYDGLSNYGGGDSIGYAYPASPFISQSHLSYQPHIRLPIPSVTAPPPSAYSAAPSNYSNSSSHRYYLSASQLAHLGPVRSGLPSSIVAEHHDQATAPRISLSSLGSTFRCQSVVSEITNSAYSRSNMNSIDPPDEQILYELERLLESCDLMTTTKKQIREQLSAVFGVRLHHRKAFINGHIDEYLRRAHG